MEFRFSLSIVEFLFVCYRMTTIQAIRLRAQINCLYLTKEFSHLLVSVKDGKLFVLTPEKKSRSKTGSKT